MPLALLLVIGAAGAAVDNAVRSETAPPQAAAASSSTRGEDRARSRRHFWIVRSGHTLSEISSRTGVSVARLEALNPGKDLGTLQLGQRVKVR